MRKGQAAMEFLMTYGWAILVVIVAVGALAYFGVLNPSKLLPEKCSFPAGMDCVGKASISATNGITFVLANNNGADINLTDSISDMAAGQGGSCGVITAFKACPGTGCTPSATNTTNATSQKILNNNSFKA